MVIKGGARIQKKSASLGRKEEDLTAKEKAGIVQEIVQGKESERRASLKEILAIAQLSKSSYEYAIKRAKKPENPDDLRIKGEIRAIWLRSKKRYGYRKILIELKTRYFEKINHKKVLKLMNGLGIHAILCGHDKKYCSYRGRIGKTAPNILKRDFHANASLQKAGTDVTEFKCSWGKIYLSPIIDFYNDEILSYTISESPNMGMVMDMLSELHRKFPFTKNMILHSDQGWQYQMATYQKRLAEYGIIQSMSRKGNCLDNGKTENLFSKMKKEMFYGHENEFHNSAELKKAIDDYVDWYNNRRIVERLGGAPVCNRSIAPIPLLCYSSI